MCKFLCKLHHYKPLPNNAQPENGLVLKLISCGVLKSLTYWK
ncbi:unnamed protein product [Brugia timori]|uniref:Uncharacterized protein n=1 Tax=Brugia timori TaxID=42155 RepID=A0A0R3Q4W9_9BILA|nr:unnamed protein product [Brugia timori]